MIADPTAEWISAPMSKAHRLDTLGRRHGPRISLRVGEKSSTVFRRGFWTLDDKISEPVRVAPIGAVSLPQTSSG